MIETTVLNYLEDALPVHSYMERPEDPEASFVVVSKAGSSVTNRISKANITIQSYATTLAEAAALNELVKAAMDEMVVLDSISKVELNSDYDYTDTSMKAYRYQAVYVITHY